MIDPWTDRLHQEKDFLVKIKIYKTFFAYSTPGQNKLARFSSQNILLREHTQGSAPLT
jgi:hypothetical protein